MLAAASTNNARQEIAANYHPATGVTVRITTGGSNALANQVIAGVPGDLFLSASPDWAAAALVVSECLERRERRLVSAG